MHSNLYQTLSPSAQKEKSFIWEKTTISPFHELIIGWNAQRPSQGHYHISLSLKLEGWCPWFSYAIWGTNSQRSFEHRLGPIHVFQDTVNMANGHAASGWRVKVDAIDGSDLLGLQALYATTPPLQPPQKMDFFQDISLEVPKISQIKINDSRNMRICSPISTTAVVRFLNPKATLTPLEFADKVWDNHFDIYGHWVFAAAQAYAELGSEWETRVKHLSGFEDIYKSLLVGYPVVVSIKGPLPGSLHPYSNGHLLVVRGYNPTQQKVRCMDPAYPENSQTYVDYALEDFLNAWQKRKNIAYIFHKVA